MSQTCDCTKPVVMVPVRGLQLALDNEALSGIDGGASADAVDYSLTEQWTGKHWLDGKKIYQRTYACGAMPNKGIKRVPLDIPGGEYVVDIRGITKGTGWFLPLPHVSTVDGISLFTEYNATGPQTVGFETNYNYSLCTESYVTVQYTCTDR